jgi:hypothetical protein
VAAVAQQYNDDKINGKQKIQVSHPRPWQPFGKIRPFVLAFVSTYVALGNNDTPLS